MSELREARGDERDVSADQISLGRRLRQPRTILSLVIPIILLLLISRVALNVDLEELARVISQANPALLLLAFAVFYLGFPIRGLRWVLLLRGSGYRLGVPDATEIIFLSWLVNCLVPAKLGDIYRAYLLKINSTVSLSRTFGTVFIERVFDLFAITILALAAGFWSFRTGLPVAIQLVFGIGVVVVIILAAAMLTMRNFGRRIIERLPLPDKVVEFYDRFEEGVFSAVGMRSLPVLSLVTALVWATEAGRLFFVIQALGFDDLQLGISGVVFVALVASLMTAVPFTPAGLGAVEGALFAVLTVVYGVPPGEAVAITLVDRAISYFSVIVFGSIAYIVSPKRRGGLELGAPIEPIEPLRTAG